MASTKSTTNAGMNFFSFSPWSFTPAPNRTASTQKVRRSLIQNLPFICAARDFFSATFSQRCQVLNLRAEKSKAWVRTATAAIAMTMNPSQQASQSSVFQSLDRLELVLISIGFSISVIFKTRKYTYFYKITFTLNPSEVGSSTISREFSRIWERSISGVNGEWSRSFIMKSTEVTPFTSP